MSGLPRALLQLLSSAVMLKYVKLQIVSEALYIEGTCIVYNNMYSEECVRKEFGVMVGMLQMTNCHIVLGLMVQCG